MVSFSGYSVCYLSYLKGLVDKIGGVMVKCYFYTRVFLQERSS